MAVPRADAAASGLPAFAGGSDRDLEHGVAGCGRYAEGNWHSHPRRVLTASRSVFPGLNARRGRGGDGDGLAGPRIAPLPRRPALRRERPEARDGNGFALGETVADGGEDGGDHPVGRGFVESEVGGQLRAEFGPGHVVLPL